MSEPTSEVHVPPPAPLPKGEREYRAFQRLLPGLLATHAGQYVAVHEENVVDAGPDDLELVQRVHERIGYVPIHVGLVVHPQPLPACPAPGNTVRMRPRPPRHGSSVQNAPAGRAIPG